MIDKFKFKEAVMAFDFKKEYKEFYMPKNRQEIDRYAKSMGCL